MFYTVLIHDAIEIGENFNKNPPALHLGITSVYLKADSPDQAAALAIDRAFSDREYPLVLAVFHGRPRQVSFNHPS